ncbi:hypothetical protein KC318_g7330 [Hortaea werneckii]|uniref:Myb-like domain-containing protein n=1 Tax=Hortaea werneckii TaxID=91943 RepID=A0A3M6YQW4_HORWE|nr:hypothetical protein KC334_g7182 [Hortaea werneckii]KAI7665088.1 hypothetical protein KC318_g7330 [Hortaea werneckii]RMY05440.1 hypothetical protein D0867_10022 [Hortaea werneckii]RMY35227.1 hypothetical protein D0866_04736 [Hortaea werneckii]
MSPNQTQQPSPPGSSDSVSPPPGASSSKKRTAAEAELKPSKNRRTSCLRAQEPDETQPEEVDRDQSEHEHATDPIDPSHPREPSAGPSSAASAESRDGEPSGSSPARLPSNAGQRWTPEANEMLLDMRRRNTPYSAIGRRLGKTGLACRLHFHNLTKAKKARATAERNAYLAYHGYPPGGPIVGSSSQFAHLFGSRSNGATFPFSHEAYYAAPPAQRPSSQSYNFRPILPAESTAPSAENNRAASYGGAREYSPPVRTPERTASDPEAMAQYVYNRVEQRGAEFWSGVARETGMPEHLIRRVYYQNHPAQVNGRGSQGYLPGSQNAPPPMPPMNAPASSTQHEQEAASALWNMSSSTNDWRYTNAHNTYGSGSSHPGPAHTAASQPPPYTLRQNSGEISPRSSTSLAAGSRIPPLQQPLSTQLPIGNSNNTLPALDYMLSRPTEPTALPTRIAPAHDRSTWARTGAPGASAAPANDPNDREKPDDSGERQDSVARRDRMSVANVMNPPSS